MANPVSILQACEERGLHMTSRRRQIAVVLDELDGAYTAEEACEAFPASGRPTLPLATMYRTIRLMTEAGILAEVGQRDGRRIFRRAPEVGVCLIDAETGRRMEINDPLLREHVLAAAAAAGLCVGDRVIEIALSAPPAEH